MRDRETSEAKVTRIRADMITISGVLTLACIEVVGAESAPCSTVAPKRYQSITHIYASKFYLVISGIASDT